MIASANTPLAAAVGTFVTALGNLLVLIGAWHTTPETLAALNTVVLSAFGVLASLRTVAQHKGTLTATPDVPDKPTS